MAGAAGFEPANVDSKNRCLTAWRRPKSITDMLLKLNSKYINYLPIYRIDKIVKVIK